MNGRRQRFTEPEAEHLEMQDEPMAQETILTMIEDIDDNAY